MQCVDAKKVVVSVVVMVKKLCCRSKENKQTCGLDCDRLTERAARNNSTQLEHIKSQGCAITYTYAYIPIGIHLSLCAYWRVRMSAS